MNREDRITLFSELLYELRTFCDIEIEHGIMCCCLQELMKPYDEYISDRAQTVCEILKQKQFPTDMETVIEFFEFMLDKDIKSEKGIVFTPKYIADYIVSNVLREKPWDKEKKFLDPGCGGGIFLVSAAEKLHHVYGIDMDDIIQNYIYGMDIEPDNVRRCMYSLRLLSARYGGQYQKIKCNVRCCDSLKTTWSEAFGCDNFDYIIGNPPYVNPHDMNKNTIDFLKDTFKTTQSGVFNIFYAFVEHAMENISSTGILGYIVPNNFLTIKSALDLRKYLQNKQYLFSLLDFGENMVFRPVRTYNCIMLLKKQPQQNFYYSVMERVDEIEENLERQVFSTMPMDQLDYNGWNLVDDQTRNNLSKIENQMISIKPFIRTGIATLKDSVYMVEKDDHGFFKCICEKKIYIESDLVKPIYKIPELKRYSDINDAQRYIIFPYIKEKQGYVLIQEEKLKECFPLTYQALLACKDVLDTRDKGRGNPQGWYAYGRSQGLNKYGRKLLFPTFANHPKFMMIENENALFCNGYAIFENDQYELDILVKILNSKVMDYYVRNSSYAIEGGYYCYQKKYIERFSIPWLNEEQTAQIKCLSGIQLDDYIWNLYDLA